MKMKDFWRQEYYRQERWVEEHGGTVAGYVARYGSIDDAEHYGTGGEAIYKADADELDRLRQRAFGGAR